MKQEEINEKAKEYANSAIESNPKPRYYGFLKGVKFAQSKMYSEEDMINFAWWLSNNVGLYSSDEVAHFEGEYLKKWKTVKKR